MANFSEQFVRRRNIRHFIRLQAQGPDGRQLFILRLKRDVFKDNGSGGRVLEGTVQLGPQEFALQSFKRRQTDEANLTALTYGRDDVTRSQMLLITEVDTDVKKDDYFEWEMEEIMKPGIWKVEYVATWRTDRKHVGIYYHSTLE